MSEVITRKTYSFCEPSFAGSLVRWCIRELSVQGPKYTGGIDTPSLCGRVQPFGAKVSGKKNPGVGGWDVRVEMTALHVAHACPECVRAYQAMLKS